VVTMGVAMEKPARAVTSAIWKNFMVSSKKVDDRNAEWVTVCLMR